MNIRLLIVEAPPGGSLIFTPVPRRGILRTSPKRRFRKFGEDLSLEPVCGTTRSGYEVARGGLMTRKKDTRTVYRIVARSELGESYASAFEGMRMETEDGRTILTGEVKDQPHLFGILERINGLGLELLSVHAQQEDASPSALGHPVPLGLDRRPATALGGQGGVGRVAGKRRRKGCYGFWWSTTASTCGKPSQP
jgi:hypothetical protein